MPLPRWSLLSLARQTVEVFAQRTRHRLQATDALSRGLSSVCRACPHKPRRVSKNAETPYDSTDFHEVSCPSSVSYDRSPQPWACLTQFVPLSGFLNLVAVYSFDRVEALSHASSAHGVRPFRVFPSRAAGHSHRMPLPLRPLTYFRALASQRWFVRRCFE